MRIEPPGNSGKKTAEAESQKLVACGVDAGGPNSHLILPDGGEGKGGQSQIRASEPEAGYPYDQACENRTQCTEGNGAPWRNPRIFIEQSCAVGPHSKEEGMSEVHLAGKT